MKNIQKKIVLFFAFTLACVGMHAAAPGATCYTAIPMGENYSETINGPKTVWYSAWTFDLPITVYFIPQNESDPMPEVEMDFTCRPGIYTDSILCSLFCKTSSGSGIDMNMPHKPSLLSQRLQDGTLVYYLALGKKYRDLLLRMGIDYNVEVFVKVTYKSAGEINLAPDDMFSNCMDGHKFMHLGDTVQVKTLDKNRHVIVPYVQWQEDSIRYIWDGTADVTAAVGYGCSYDPESADEVILDKPVLHAPHDTLKMTSAELKHYVQEAESEAGMFYAKFYTSGTGTIKIEQVPQAPPQGGATLLRYDRATPVAANDTDALYAIPYTWTTATKFATPTNHIFRMYVGTTPNFNTTNAIACYQFNRNDEGHWIGMKETEMKALWAHTSDKYLYIRFECTEKTNITPGKWYPSDCYIDATEIAPDTTFTVNSKSATIYRIYYNDIKDGDLSVYWNQTALCKMLVSGSCSIGTNGSAASVIYYEEMEDKETYVIPASDLEDWADAVSEEGYLYLRFYTTRSGGGKVTITSTAPQEQDPAPMVYPGATIAISCIGELTVQGQQMTVRVSEDQDLKLYAGEITDETGLTPQSMWHQSSVEKHKISLLPGVYTLIGANESVRIVVK